MSTTFCNDGGSNTSPYETWAKAATTLAVAITEAGADGLVYVDSTHAETTATVNLAGPSGATPCVCISVDSAAEPPTAFLKGAVIQPSDANVDLSVSGGLVLIGFLLGCADNFTVASDSFLLFVDCDYTANNAASNDVMSIGTADDIVSSWDGGIIDSTVSGLAFVIGGGTIHSYRNLSLVASTLQAELIESAFGQGGNITIENCDFSNGPNGFDILGTTSLPAGVSSGQTLIYYVSNCKLPDATSTVIADTHLEHGSRIEAFNIDDGDTIYSTLIRDFRGEVVDDTAKTRDATYDGTNKYTLKITATAETIRGRLPFRFLLREYWAAAGKTHTVHFVTHGALTFDVADLWCEFEGPDATTGALGLRISTADTAGANAYGLGTPGSLTTDAAGASEWAGEEASSNFYEISHDFSTSDQAGVHRVWVNFAAANTEAVYVDPAIEVST